MYKVRSLLNIQCKLYFPHITPPASLDSYLPSLKLGDYIHSPCSSLNTLGSPSFDKLPTILQVSVQMPSSLWSLPWLALGSLDIQSRSTYFPVTSLSLFLKGHNSHIHHQEHGIQGMRTLNLSHLRVLTPNTITLVEQEAEIFQKEMGYGGKRKDLLPHRLSTLLNPS